MFIDRRRQHQRRLRPLVCCVAVSVLAGVAACTSGEADAPPVRTVVEKVWTAAGIDPVSSVENVDGVGIVYGTTPDGLVIYGLDPATGAVWWQRPAVPLAQADGVWVNEIDGSVVYFRATGSDRVSRLVIADPRTGADRTVSSARYWASYPLECDDDTGWACLDSYTQSADGHWNTHHFRVERETGKTLPDVRSATNVPDGANEIPIVNLFFSYPDDEEAMIMGRFVGGKEVWSKPAAKIFGPDLPSPRQFWFHDPRGHGFAMFTALGPGTGATPDRTLDLTKDIATARISIADGKVAWTRPGSWEGCGLQPLLDWDPDAPKGEPNAYLCHYTGSAVWDPDPSRTDQLITTHLSVTMDRIEAATGKVSWSTELGDAKALIDDATGDDIALLDDKHLLVPNSTGGLVIDLESGQTRRPAADDVFWCATPKTFPRVEPLYPSSSPVTTGDRSGLVRPCRLDGGDAPVPPTIPSEIGESFDGDFRLIAIADAVAGFLVPPPAPDASASDTNTNSADTGGAAGDTEGNSAEPAVSSTEATTAHETTVSTAAAGASDRDGGVQKVWAAKGFSAKTTPTIIGGTAVLYATVGTDLFLIGLDPATGAERWRQSASAAAFSPDQEVKVVEIDGQVAFLRPGVPSPSTLAQIVLIDAASGAEELATEQLWWTELPTACADDKAFLCAPAKNVGLDNILSTMNFRIHRVTGAVTLAPDDTPDDTKPYTALWNDLVDITGAPEETVGVVEDDQLLWSKPLQELLGPDATLDHGWYASEDVGAKDVLQLSATVGWKSDGTNYPALDLAKNLITVGINRRDGTVLWREPGTSPQCRYLLPGPVSVSTPGSKNPALRCRYTGRLDSAPAGRSYGLTVPTDLSVSIERVDLQTGEAIWSAPVGPAEALAVSANGLAVPMLDDHRILVGGQVIDLDDGSIRSLAASETVWCPGPQAFEQPVEWFGADGSVRTDRRAEGDAAPCGADGKPSSTTPAAIPLAISTVTDDGLRLVSTPSGVVAFRVPL